LSSPPGPILEQLIEQNPRAIQKRVDAQQWFRAFGAARRTITGYKAIHMMRSPGKWRVRDRPKLCFSTQPKISPIVGTKIRDFSTPPLHFPEAGVAVGQHGDCGSRTDSARPQRFAYAPATILFLTSSADECKTCAGIVGADHFADNHLKVCLWPSMATLHVAPVQPDHYFLHCRGGVDRGSNGFIPMLFKPLSDSDGSISDGVGIHRFRYGKKLVPYARRLAEREERGQLRADKGSIPARSDSNGQTSSKSSGSAGHAPCSGSLGRDGPQ
jgi:hypothetical protein